MNRGLIWIETIPFGNWNKLWISIPEYLLLYAIICCCFGWIVHRKSVLIKLGAVFILLFSAGFSYKRFRASNQDEMIFLNLRNHTGMIFKKGNEAIVLTDLKTIDKTFQYSVQPYLDSCKSTRFRLIRPGQNFRNAVFTMQNRLIQFKNKLIFVADKQFEHQVFLKKIKVDVVFITGNPRINLGQVSNNLIFDLLIVDSNNSDYLIQSLTEEAALDGRKIKILKRNNAFLLHSKTKL